MDTFANVIDLLGADEASNPEARNLLKARVNLTRAHAEMRKAQERYAEVHGAHHVGDRVMYDGGICTVEQSWAEITPHGVLKIMYLLFPAEGQEVKLLAAEGELSSTEVPSCTS